MFPYALIRDLMFKNLYINELIDSIYAEPTCKHLLTNEAINNLGVFLVCSQVKGTRICERNRFYSTVFLYNFAVDLCISVDMCHVSM